MKRLILLCGILALLLCACAKEPAAQPDEELPAENQEQQTEENETDAEQPETDDAEDAEQPETGDAADTEQVEEEEQEQPSDEAQQETVATDPETPAAEPETPAAEPEAPAAEPETPAAEPEAPASEPETPATEPETPASEPEEPDAEPVATVDEVANEILQGADLPQMGQIAVDADSFPYYLFIDPISGATATAREPMIGTTPISIVVLRLPEGQDAASVAATVKANANPNKWVCNTAESVVTAAKGQFVLLVMGPADLTATVSQNFQALDWNLG